MFIRYSCIFLQFHFFQQKGLSQQCPLQLISSWSSLGVTPTPPAACPLRPVSLLTPFLVYILQYELRGHPNPDKVAFVLQGLHQGFHLGFNQYISLKSASGNMASALSNPQVIDNYLRSEVQLGRLAGPFLQPPLRNLHVSRFGIIPKHNQPGRWRLILDLSSPAGHSVNDVLPVRITLYSIPWISGDCFLVYCSSTSCKS